MYALIMLLMLAPTDASAQGVALRRGVDAASQQDWQAAYSSFSRSAVASSSTAAQLAVAESLFQIGRYSEASSRFAELYRSARTGTRSSDAWIVLRCSQCLAHQQDWQAAAKVAQAALATEYDAARIAKLRYILGRCLSAQNSHNAAREQFFHTMRSASAGDAIKDRASWMIAYGYAADGELAAAREAFLRLERRSPSSPLAARALVEAGRCSERAGDWDVARATYQQAVEAYPASQYTSEMRRRLAVVEVRLDGALRR